MLELYTVQNSHVHNIVRVSAPIECKNMSICALMYIVIFNVIFKPLRPLPLPLPYSTLKHVKFYSNHLGFFKPKIAHTLLEIYMSHILPDGGMGCSTHSVMFKGEA